MAKGNYPRKRGLHEGISNDGYRCGQQVARLGLTGARRAEPEYFGPPPEIEEREKVGQQLQEWDSEDERNRELRREESEAYKRRKWH